MKRMDIMKRILNLTIKSLIIVLFVLRVNIYFIVNVSCYPEKKDINDVT